MISLVALVVAAGPAHPELGRVAWMRDFDAAQAQARRSQKPLLVLFDEVPGCSTVRGFGAAVLSDEALVRRIERDFVPVVVFNNVDGADRRVLDAFEEPRWNNPVVRIMDAERRPLAPRFSGPYTREAFTALLDSLSPASPYETLTVSAACFWECEARLGRLEAVRASRVGFLRGEEVVEVEFDPRLASREQLLRDATRLDCADHVFTRSDVEHRRTRELVGDRAVRTDEALRVSERDTKYYLKQRGRPAAGLTSLEQVRVNAALRFGEDPEAARSACQQKAP
jgi:hypothetical protein